MEKTEDIEVQDGRQSLRRRAGAIALVGAPNVGKSAIFNKLTGAYVVVSNYPGTTVELARGQGTFGWREYEVVDTPGMYSLLPITEEERVARDLLLEEQTLLVLHVVDAKNLDRMLPFTLQLLEAGLPTILVVNILDEAERLGMKIDTELLAQRLGIPVVGTISTTGYGVAQLKRAIAQHRVEGSQAAQFSYSAAIETAVVEIASLLKGEYGISRRAVAALLVQSDESLLELVEKREGRSRAEQIRAICHGLEQTLGEPVGYLMAQERRSRAAEMLVDVIQRQDRRQFAVMAWLGRITMHPIYGLPFLFAILYYGLYKMVGVFGAGTLVDFMESQIFERFINPFVNDLVLTYIPYPWLQELLALDYGIITLGLRYAVAIILPIVAVFFFVFAIIEDSGYLPRLALLVDRFFKGIGLNGRAVIPMALGFGCDTMATMVSRTLETRRERVIATLLLALAIPCSAQLGVVLALLSHNPVSLMIWVGFMVAVFVLIGWLAAQVLPGQRPDFYMEIPPLRVPRISSIIIKTYARVHWYLLEVIPFFVLASVVIWLGNITGFYEVALGFLQPVVEWIGLPAATSSVFLFGFFRRDYGAAGLYDLAVQGALTEAQLVVAAATLTLFVPCIAQFIMMIKERGVRTALAIAGFILPFAFLCGYVLNYILTIVGFGQ